MTRIIFDPLIPLSLWFPLLLAAGTLLAWYGWSSRKRIAGRRRVGMLTLMSVAFVLPLAVLLNPTWMEPIPPPPGKPILRILVDQSASMNTQDVANGQTRYYEAVALAAEAVKRFESKYEVRLSGFDKELKNTTLNDLTSQKPEGGTTDLAAAFEQSLNSEQPQGQFVLLLSDGVHNHGSLAKLRESLAKAKAMAAPVFTRTLTGTSEVEDFELELGLSQEIAFAAQHVPVTVHLRQRGTSAQTAHVSLKQDGQTL